MSNTTPEPNAVQIIKTAYGEESGVMHVRVGFRSVDGALAAVEAIDSYSEFDAPDVTTAIKAIAALDPHAPLRDRPRLLAGHLPRRRHRDPQARPGHLRRRPPRRERHHRPHPARLVGLTVR